MEKNPGPEIRPFRLARNGPARNLGALCALLPAFFGFYWGRAGFRLPEPGS